MDPVASPTSEVADEPRLLESVWVFFAATFLWTWSFWGAAMLFDVPLESTSGSLLLIGGLLGTLVTGVGFTYATKEGHERRDFWRRVIDIRQIPLTWILVVLLFVPILNASAALLDYLWGGVGAVWGQSLVDAATNPFGLLLSMLFATVVPFIEELGWRGYALDRLQAGYTSLTSTLILGTFWSLWHLPLFFIDGTYQAGLGVGSIDFWMFFIGVVPLSFAFTWIYNNTGRSILAAILFHGMVNFTGELFDIVGRANTISIGLWALVAVGITLIWGRETFTDPPVGRVTGRARGLPTLSAAGTDSRH